METLTIIIYVLLIILIIVAIAIGVKLIGTLHKVDGLLEDVSDKVKTLDKLFDFIDAFNDKMAMVGDSVVGFVSGGIKRLFKDRKKSKKEKKESEE